jgi:hypothetical protein
MNRRTITSILMRLGWAAFFLLLLFLATPAGLAAPLFSGTLGTAPAGGATGTLETRINRPGTGPTATCAGVTWPENIGGGPETPGFIYNVHYFTNNTALPLCTPITFTMLTEGEPVGNMQLSAF